MVRLRTLSVLLITMFVLAPLSGCLDNEEEKPPGFQWPERVENGCLGEDVNASCEVYLDGFTTPTNSLHHPTQNEVWISDLDGRIVAWDGSEQRLVANISNLISNCHTEAGLLGFSFATDFANASQVLFTYIGKANCETKEVTNLYLASGDVVNGTVAENSVQVLREIEQPYRNHNGGHLLALGDHTYLWGVGDGGGSNDPQGHGQNETSPLGTIQHFHYHNGTIAPLHNTTGTDQDYTLHRGLRNPWKFDVDAQNRLWIADVGQQCFEEVSMVPVLQASNFGWSEREGNREFTDPSDCTKPASEPPAEMTDPVLIYEHEYGRCSITGGLFLDWGPEAWQGGFLYGDFCTGEIWRTTEGADGAYEGELLVDTETMLVGFGEGLDGELLLFTWTGTVYSLDTNGV